MRSRGPRVKSASQPPQYKSTRPAPNVRSVRDLITNYQGLAITKLLGFTAKRFFQLIKAQLIKVSKSRFFLSRRFPWSRTFQ